MTKTNKKILGILLAVLTLAPATKVWAQEYEEVGYDELVQRLGKKKSAIISNQSSVFDDIMIHAGFGLVTSTFNISAGSRELQKQMNGFQVSMGIDLFSANWAAEGSLRNFGTQVDAGESRSFRETDLKLMFRSVGDANKIGYRLGTGLATRYLQYYDSGISINETTPSGIFFGGIDAQLGRNFSLGTELGYRSAMVNNSSDKSSIDLMLRLDTYF